MSTPSPPAITIPVKSGTAANLFSATAKKAPVADRTTKTPFQANSIYQKSFRSEAQPVRLISRFANTEVSNKSGASRLAATTNHGNHLVMDRVAQAFSSRMQKQNSEPVIKYTVTVNDKTYKVLRKIGSGGSAKVYECLEPKTLLTVAIKIINLAKADLKTQKSYFNERDILMKLSNSNHVVRMFDSEHKQHLKELLIVMEKGDADLSQVIDTHFKTRGKLIDGIFIKFYWHGMVQAVREIHSHGIVHADLKPVNFILVKNQIKLIDFGIANAVGPDCTSVILDYQIGTINYMAPEALKNRALDASFLVPFGDGDDGNQYKKTVIKYNNKVDIWSLGCILYNLVYGRPPYDIYNDVPSKVQAITNPSFVIEFPTITNTKLLDCMKCCLRYKPNDRISAAELLEHPYLKEDTLWIEQAEFRK